MALSAFDLLAFVAFLVVVVTVAMLSAKKKDTASDFFLAGRGLGWVFIGFSLIASNISTEHFVGMTGQAYGGIGLAVASWEWLAAIAMVIVAWWFLPKFLTAGIYTMPEFLEYRYDATTRAIMAGFMVVLYVVTVLASVLYSGALFLSEMLNIPKVMVDTFGANPEEAELTAFITCVWVIGFITGLYTVYGGLKAVVTSDLIQGSALLLGGLLVTVLCISALGDGSFFSGWSSMVANNQDKLHMFRPLGDPDLPWLTLFTGIWVPVLFYWGLNQFITQRVLAARSLAVGQKGIFFAACIKLVLPLIIVIPGMVAAQLYGDQIGDHGDRAYPYMLRQLLPSGLRGLMLAAIAGAVMSTVTAGLNSSSTVFTLDLYKRYRPNATDKQLIVIGRLVTVAIVVLACVWTPVIRSFRGVFNYIQEIWGFVSVPTFAVFVIGLLKPRVPPKAAKAAFIVGPSAYALFRIPSWINPEPKTGADATFLDTLTAFSNIHFLYHMAMLFVIVASVMLIIGKLNPLAEPRVLRNHPEVDITPHPRQYQIGGAIIAATILLYVFFS